MTRRKGRVVWHAYRQVARRNVYMHREILGAIDRGTIVDHANGDGLDNRRLNLRKCTHQQNIASRHATVAATGSRGVTYLKRLKSKPWVASIMVSYQKKHIGYFATKAEAEAAFARAARSAFGEFANV